jgi:hypothetical protein
LGVLPDHRGTGHGFGEIVGPKPTGICRKEKRGLCPWPGYKGRMGSNGLALGPHES